MPQATEGSTPASPPDRRSRKRLATRLAISDAATRLFHDRGFDQVTVDDIAEAADVGRKTVFNHFARKEDMFFDLDEAGRDALLAWMAERPQGTSPVESLRAFAHQAAEGASPYVVFIPESRMFVETMLASDALKARARAIRDELATLVAAMLVEAAGDEAKAAEANLVASMLLAAWTVALGEAHALYASSGDAKAAAALFHRLVDAGADAAKVASPF
jgi:AcrR family transcriptional regulator